jgi:drug/metabolite transporter (DMT)-like permease
MSDKNASALIARNGLIGLMALALLVAWYCVVTPRYISPENRSPACLLVVLATSFSFSLLITVRRFKNRTLRYYFFATVVGVAVTAAVYTAFMLILLNTVGS